MVTARAIRDTWTHIIRQLLVGVAVGFLTFIVQCGSEPKGVPCDVSNLQAGLIGGGIWLGFVLIFNLVMAPVRMYLERPEKQRPRVRLVSEKFTSAATTVVRQAAAPMTPAQESTVPALWRFHIAQVPTGIQLACRRGFRDVPEDAICEVEEPDGSIRDGRLHRAEDTSRRCIYPEDFPDAVPSSGPYFVHWLQPARKPDTVVRLTQPLDFTIEV
jgi:hypothetical protein